MSLIPRHAAFTLIELILAIGVAALVLLTANLVLYTALHLRDDTTQMVDAATPVDTAASFLKRDLACCVTPTNGTSKVLSGGFRAGNGLQSAGESDPVQIEMFTTTGSLSDSQPWGEIQRVSYELKTPVTPNAVGRDLYRSVARNLLTFNSPQVDDQFMLGGVQSITFSCYDGAQWQDSWDTTSVTAVNTNLPTAVKVQIQMAGNALAQPIELVVPLDAMTRSNMVFTTTGG
ncbi:MAG TPA: type II secretion system protein GspJ [Candidatus Sulfotelmatobacter sp.]|jgi:type II secretion system protein J|nr:type II secretion system protein GspJ [Candidatus Sulfotelmatobacter sp.]